MIDFGLSELKRKLENFKSWVEWPRLYIADELDTIINEIDVEAEIFLKNSTETQTKSEKEIIADNNMINANRKQMLDEVVAFEKKIFATLTSNDLDSELALVVKNHENKLHELEEMQGRLSEETLLEEISDLEYFIDVSIYEFDCRVKQNSSLLFLNKLELDMCHYAICSHINQRKKASTFGFLYVLNDCVSKENFR